MEKLIKIQAIINQIEDLTLREKFKSEFYYKDDKTLIIETYCWNQACIYKMLLDNTENIVVNILSNNIIKIYEFNF